MESILADIYDWLNSGSYTWYTEATAYAIQTATIAYLKFLAWVIPFAWGIAKAIIQDLGISQALQSAWGSLDSTVVQAATFFKIPEAVNNIITALVTRIAFRFIPGF